MFTFINIRLLIVCSIFLTSTSTNHNNTSTKTTTSTPVFRNKTTFPEGGCRAESSAFGIGFSVFLIFVILISIVGNAIVIAGVLYTPSLRSQVTNRFIISLAVSDILTPIIILPFHIDIALRDGAFCHSDAACKFLVMLSTFFNIASLSNIFLITVDRFTAIVRPLSYVTIMSESRAAKLIGLVWIYSAIWAALGIFNWETPHEISTAVRYNSQGIIRCVNRGFVYFMAMFSFVYALPLVLMGGMYLKIMRSALKHIRAIAALEVVAKQDGKRKDTGKRRMKNFRSTKSILVIYGAFIVCWLPNCVMSIHSTLNPKWWRDFRKNNLMLFYFVYYVFAKFLPPLSNTLNPFIYSLLNRNFRIAFKATVYRVFGKEARQRQLDLLSSYHSNKHQSFRRGRSFTTKAEKSEVPKEA